MTRTTVHRWSSPELILVATNLLESQPHILHLSSHVCCLRRAMRITNLDLEACP